MKPGSLYETRYITARPAPADKITIQLHAATVTSGVAIPGARTTACTKSVTRPRMSAAHATAMPLASQNFPLAPLRCLSCCAARKPPRLLCPFSVASCVAVDPSTSLASSSAGPPACARMCAASALPRIAAQWSGVHPSLSARAMFASQYSRSFTASGKPLYAAQWRGVRPSLSCASTFASQRILKW